MAHADIQVSELIYKIRLAADQQGANLRTSDTNDLIPLINDSYARFVAAGTGTGWPFWLQSQGGQTPTGRATDSVGDLPFTEISTPVSTVKPEGFYKFEVRMPNGEWWDLEPIQFNQINLYQSGWNPTGSGRPQAWAIIGMQSDFGGPNCGITIALMPPCDIAYSYRIWYAAIQQCTATTDYLNVGMIGADWWIVWDVAETLAVRDHYPDMAQLAASKKAGLFTELCNRVNHRNKGATFRVRDSRGMRRARALWPWSR